MDDLIFLGGDLIAHAPSWDTYHPNVTRGEQLDNWCIAHSDSALNDGAATLLNRTTVA